MGCPRTPLELLLLTWVLAELGHSSVVSTDLSERIARRRAFLQGRRGGMDDDDIGAVRADLSAVIDRRDNRTPGQRDVALASLEVLVAGDQKDDVTTETTEVDEVTRRPPRPCLNGGIRLLRSFCYCPPKYMGRYCEIYRYNSSCGGVQHGHWVYIDCNSCLCFAGVFRCQPHHLEGCAIQSADKAPSISTSPAVVEIHPISTSVVSRLQEEHTELYNSAPLQTSAGTSRMTSLFACLLLYLLLLQHDR